MSEGQPQQPAAPHSPQVEKKPAFFFKAGWIQKLFGHTWMKKFLVLEGGYLYVHKKAAKDSKKAEQAIALTFVSHLAVSIRKDGGRSYFFLTAFDGTGHLFAVDSVAELGPWVEYITKALEHANSGQPLIAAAPGTPRTPGKPTSLPAPATSSAPHSLPVATAAIPTTAIAKAMTPIDRDQALFQAIVANDVEVVRQNAKMTNVNLFGKGGLAPVHLAAKLDHDACLEVLLEVCESRFIDLRDKVLGWTPLHHACNADAVDCVNMLLKHRSDPTSVDSMGRSPAVIALQAGSKDCFETLVQVGSGAWTAAISANDAGTKAADSTGGPGAQKLTTFGITSLHIAASIGSEAVLSAVGRQSPALVQKTDESGKAPIHYASGSGRVEAVHALISLKAEIDKPDNTGSTPMMDAAFRGRAKCVELLLASGANPKLVDKDGATALHHATKSGDIETIKLLASRCPHDEADGTGMTPLELACSLEKVDAAMLLLEGVNIDSSFILHHAAEAGNARLVIMLIEKGAAISEPDKSGRYPIHYCSTPDCLAQFIGRGVGSNQMSCNGWSPLHSASSNGRASVVASLLDADAEIEMKTMSDGKTALVLACEGNHSAAAITLIDRGAKVNYVVEETGLTPLLIALQRGNFEIVTALANKGADFNAKDKSSQTCLHKACKGGNLACVQLVISKGVSLGDVDEAGDTALHFAASRNHREAVQALVSKGVPLNPLNTAGYAPIHKAAMANFSEVVSQLLRLGADARVKSADGSTPLLCAIRACHVSVVEVLTNAGNIHNDGAVLLPEAALAALAAEKAGQLAVGAEGSWLGFPAIIDRLIKKGVDPNVKSKKGVGAIHIVAGMTNIACLVVLLRNKANPDLQDSEGRTALMTAASKKNIEAVRALIDAGANTNLTRMQNVTALHEATLIGDLESSTILLEHGAQPGAKALQDVTPLHNAASSGNVKLMALLVDRGAPVNCKTARSITPLHSCAALGKPECVRFLCDHGADPDAKDENGFTPLHKAAASGSMECVKLLIERGATQLMSKQGKFPHDLVPAAVPELVDFLVKLAAQGPDLKCK